MNDKNHVYITTTLPYVNGKPHLGFAYELVLADVYARACIKSGKEVLLNTGTDEHGQKILEMAMKANISPQEYVDGMVADYEKLIVDLNCIDDIVFTRTTKKSHKEAAQRFWNIVDEAGYIYKKNYEVKYCVGCELEKTDSELENGHCLLHPNIEIESRAEENYFFAVSKLKNEISKLYDENPNLVSPSFRLNEIKELMQSKGLIDFSISRPKEKMGWGIEVPTDPTHVMYVWFDALINYISAIGWPADTDTFQKWWPVIQFAGKDQVRQQALMWQAMLIAGKIKPSKEIFIHGFITSGGEKMSKSRGNVIDPRKVIETYGGEALRYYFVREINPQEDGDFTKEKFEQAYNASLANGLGNLTQRILTLSEKYCVAKRRHSNVGDETPYDKEVYDQIMHFEFQKASDIVWKMVKELDGYVTESAPFSVVKDDLEKGKKIITECVDRLYGIANALYPFMPQTSDTIKMAIDSNTKPTSPMFHRLD